jgi:hypothetical protein
MIAERDLFEGFAPVYGWSCHGLNKVNGRKVRK